MRRFLLLGLFSIAPAFGADPRVPVVVATTIKNNFTLTPYGDVSRYEPGAGACVYRDKNTFGCGYVMYRDAAELRIRVTEGTQNFRIGEKLAVSLVPRFARNVARDPAWDATTKIVEKTDAPPFGLLSLGASYHLAQRGYVQFLGTALFRVVGPFSLGFRGTYAAMPQYEALGGLAVGQLSFGEVFRGLYFGATLGGRTISAKGPTAFDTSFTFAGNVEMGVRWRFGPHFSFATAGGFAYYARSFGRNNTFVSGATEPMLSADFGWVF